MKTRSILQISFSVFVLLWVCCCSRYSGPIKIGFSGQLSGTSGTPSTVVRNGVVLAAEHINDEGGINGRAIELLIEDDKGNAHLAPQIDQNHYQAGVEAIIGHTISEMSSAALDFCNEHELLMLSPTASADPLMGRDDYFFTLYPRNMQLARTLAEFAFKVLNVRRVSVLADYGNRLYTENYYKEFAADFRQLGGEVIDVNSFNSLNDNNFLRITDILLKNGPDAVLVVAASLDTAVVAQQLYKRKLEIPLLGCDWSSYQELIEQGGPYVKHIYIPNLYSDSQLECPHGVFIEKYRSRFKETPSIGAAVGYESMWVLAQALQLREKGQDLKQVLLHNTFEGFEEQIEFNRFGEAQRKIHIKTIKKGKFVNVETW